MQFESNGIYIKVLIGCDDLFRHRRNPLFVGRAFQHLNASTHINHPTRSYTNLEVASTKRKEFQIPTGHLMPLRKSRGRIDLEVKPGRRNQERRGGVSSGSQVHSQPASLLDSLVSKLLETATELTGTAVSADVSLMAAGLDSIGATELSA